jgi:O-antigen/teichoic acid export membrane protein
MRSAVESEPLLRLVVFVVSASVLSHVLLTVLSVGLVWRSLSPAILAPVIHSIALLLLILGVQVLVQPNGRNRFGYAGVSALLSAVGVMVAAAHYSLAPVGARAYAFVFVPAVLGVTLVSFLASYLGSRLSTAAKVVLGCLLLFVAWIVPSLLVQGFSVGE